MQCLRKLTFRPYQQTQMHNRQNQQFSAKIRLFTMRRRSLSLKAGGYGFDFELGSYSPIIYGGRSVSIAQ
jgi:hypothetical protein